MLRLAASVPDCPPSPPTDSNQLSGVPLQAQVPLSCVPPRTSWSGSCGLMETLWYCRVARPSFRLKIRFGIAASHFLQS